MGQTLVVRAQAPDDQLTRRLVFDASTMMVRASDASSRDPLLRADIGKHLEPFALAVLRRHALQRVPIPGAPGWKSTSMRTEK
jgi:hypothetical protein